MEVANEFSRMLNKLNPIYKKSMTYDNGIEMARHEKITKNTGIKIYFSFPYSSWERGTNLNEIDLKKGQIIQEKLNDTPRKIIGYKTLKEMMQNELKFEAS